MPRRAGKLFIEWIDVAVFFGVLLTDSNDQLLARFFTFAATIVPVTGQNKLSSI